jgi:ACT domain-containing protein
MKGINNTLKEQIEVLQKEKIQLQLQVAAQQLEIDSLVERLEKCEACLKKE